MKQFFVCAALVFVGWGAAIAATPGDAVVDIRNTAVQCNTSATPLPSAPMSGRNAVLVQNLGAAAIYIGDLNVTAANGIQIAAGATLSLDLGFRVQSLRGKLYCIAPGGLQVSPTDTRIVEVR